MASTATTHHRHRHSRGRTTASPATNSSGRPSGRTDRRERRAARGDGDRRRCVHSYFGFRSVAIGNGRSFNDKPVLLAHGAGPGLLAESRTRRRATTRCARCRADQGARASTPSANTRRSKIRASCTGPTARPPRLGRNGERLAFTPRRRRPFHARMAEVVARDRNHPCIVTWVPLNESWGVPEIAERASSRPTRRRSTT